MSSPDEIPRASVIIVNFNGGKYLPRCVTALQAQSEEKFECFIIDNGSTDGSIAALPELDARFTIKKLGENRGFAEANNIAARKAKSDWIACLNPDAFAHPDWLATLLATPELAKNVTMAGSRQNMAEQPGVLDGLGDGYHAFGLAYRAGCGHPDDAYVFPDAYEVFGPCGAAALYHRETFLRLGGFDERFFTYHEDVDLAYRMRRDGGICIQNNLAIVEHVSSGISGRASDFAVYYGTRNRIWTFMKNSPLALLMILFPAFLATNLFTLSWSVFRKGRFKPTFRGIWDGFFGMGFYRVIRENRNERKVHIHDIIRAFTWDPRKVYKRRIPKMQMPDNSDISNS